MTGSGQPGKPAPAEEAGELGQEIEWTREQLGETVEQLVAKADVKGRVRAKVTGLTGQAKGRAARAASQAGAQAAQARSQLKAAATQVRQKSAAVGGGTKSAARTAFARGAGPQPLRRAVVGGTGPVRQRPALLVLAAVAMATGFVALRWWRKR